MEEPGAAIPAVERQLLWGLRELLRYQPDVCGEKMLSARPGVFTPFPHGVKKEIQRPFCPSMVPERKKGEARVGGSGVPRLALQL